MNRVNRRQFLGASALTLGAVTAAPIAAPASEPATGKHRVYSFLIDPREHPDYSRRFVQPPGWDEFGDRVHFITLRGFGIKDGELVNYVEKIQKYTETYKLGDIIWPSYPIIFGRNLGDFAGEIKKRSLYLFDIWGYTPGSGRGSFWHQWTPPAGVFDLLEAKLGERWLGMDTGEEDGRYVGGYAPQMSPPSVSRLQQYFNFQRYFERYTDVQGNKMSTLVTLGLGHYFLKEGLYTFIGAESGQALPNPQLYYVFNRGAGKQYGVPWFGNASVFNRWGYKRYGTSGVDQGYAFGPTKGTSLSLLKRLMYSHILYNSMMVGFDQQWFLQELESSVEGGSLSGDTLSPIGRIQQGAIKWASGVGQPGVMVTPVAVMLDFYAGWVFPRHLYTRNVYRVWGNLPYGPGDHLTDGVFDMLYPGYQDSSYFHDESGFQTPTPYGDFADGVLTDAEGWLLRRYPVLVVASELSGGEEVRQILEAYARQGGHLVITAGNLAKFPAGLAGVQVTGKVKSFPAGQSVVTGTSELREENPFDLYPLAYSATGRVLAAASSLPAVVELPCGTGKITVLASPFGICSGEVASAAEAVAELVRNDLVDKSLARPFPLLGHVRTVLDRIYRSQMLFEVGPGLSLITCRKGPGEYTLGIANNTWRELPILLVSRCGPITSIQNLPMDQSEKGATGYLPEGMEKTDLGTSSDTHLAGGDIRIFAVKVQEENVEEIARQAAPPRPRGRFLTLRGSRLVKQEVLSRPSFFEHYDGVVVDWTYLHERTEAQLQREAGWLGRQKLRVVVDLSSGINLYPDLRLVDNIPEEYSASLDTIEGIVSKMQILKARDLLLSLHRVPENNFTRDQTWGALDATFRRLNDMAIQRQITLHLRLCLGKLPENLEEGVAFLDRVGASNLRLAPSTALLLLPGNRPEVTARLRNRAGLWLLGTPKTDIAGIPWSINSPVAGYHDQLGLANILALAPETPLVFDAVYNSPDEEYLDAIAIDHLTVRG
jgi:hypothetical protein